MNISLPYFNKEFSADTNKLAYLKVCKWVAKYVLSNDKSTKDLKETFWKVEHIGEGRYRLILYCTIDFRERENKFCEACQNYHKRFYYNEDRDCSRCNYKAFKARAREHLSIKRTYRKELINKKLNGG